MTVGAGPDPDERAVALDKLARWIYSPIGDAATDADEWATCQRDADQVVDDVLAPLLARVSELTAENERLEIELSKATQERDFVEKKVVEFTESKHKRQRDEALAERDVERARREAVEAKVAAGLSLADKWETTAGPESSAWEVFGPQKVSVPFAVEQIRAGLAAAVPLEAPKEPE